MVCLCRLLLGRRFSRERRSALHERPVRALIPQSVRFPTRQGTVFATVNVFWGTLNLAVGYLLVCHVGEFNVRSFPDALVLGAGGLLMGIQLARWFGRAYGGH